MTTPQKPTSNQVKENNVKLIFDSIEVQIAAKKSEFEQIQKKHALEIDDLNIQARRLKAELYPDLPENLVPPKGFYQLKYGDAISPIDIFLHTNEWLRHNKFVGYSGISLFGPVPENVVGQFVMDATIDASCYDHAYGHGVIKMSAVVFRPESLLPSDLEICNMTVQQYIDFCYPKSPVN
jgi:hypothetical protein